MTVPQEKLNDLFVYCVQFAETMLKDAGEFYPFAAVLTNDLAVGAVGASNEEEKPEPVELYKSMEKVLRQMAQDREISAAAIASDVNIPAEYEPPFEDGVRVHLESRGFSRMIYVPYKIQQDEVVFFEPVVAGIDADLFKNITE